MTRSWAVGALVVLIVALAASAAVLIPWQRPPAPRADQLAALAELPPDRVAWARAFRSALRPGSYGGLGVGLAGALVLGLTPLGARIVTLAGRPFGGHWIAQAVLGGLVVVIVLEVLTLPFAAWGHTVAVRYGISTQSWGPWAVDVLKSFGVGAVLGGLTLFGFYGLARAAPRWWWAPGAVGAAALVVLLSFVLPVIVEPIFNRFTPMPDSALRSELVALADRDGVPVRDVLIADASRRTRAVNAYVSGLGPTRRIVVYDTMLSATVPAVSNAGVPSPAAPNADTAASVAPAAAPAGRLTTAETVSVVAHELGHAKRHDVAVGTLIGALGTAAGVIVLYLLGSWTGLLRLAGASSIGDPRAIGLVLALATVAGLIGAPAQAFVSRRIEARADAHALALTGDPGTFEAMQRRLGTVNLSDPDPPRWEYVFSASHPSTVERMAAARAYARGDRR